MGPLNLAWAARFPRRGPSFNLTVGAVKNFTIELLVILPKKYPKIN